MIDELVIAARSICSEHDAGRPQRKEPLAPHLRLRNTDFSTNFPCHGALCVTAVFVGFSVPSFVSQSENRQWALPIRGLSQTEKWTTLSLLDHSEVSRFEHPTQANAEAGAVAAPGSGRQSSCHSANSLPTFANSINGPVNLAMVTALQKALNTHWSPLPRKARDVVSVIPMPWLLVKGIAESGMLPSQVEMWHAGG